MQRFLILSLVFAAGMLPASVRAASDPGETTRLSEQVLADLMAIPARQIPQSLLAEAQGIAIIPNVTKVGFIAGVRHGHGVVMVRDPEGEWTLPQFITLTGGSVGWQAGIQGTDVVLVFKTRKGVEGLMNGKFTIGADASVSAGPIGRNAAAATDATLQSEILSYSRSRGLFLGVALDGSVLEIDHHAHAAFYGSPRADVPQRVPQSSVQLRDYLAELTRVNPPVGAPGEPAPPANSPRKLEALRRALVHNVDQLYAILSPEWRQYLALPKDVVVPAGQPDLETLYAVQQRFSLIDTSPKYRDLAQRPEFQAAYGVLREYTDAIAATRPKLELPPPPN